MKRENSRRGFFCCDFDTCRYFRCDNRWIGGFRVVLPKSQNIMIVSKNTSIRNYQTVIGLNGVIDPTKRFCKCLSLSSKFDICSYLRGSHSALWYNDKQPVLHRWIDVKSGLAAGYGAYIGCFRITCKFSTIRMFEDCRTISTADL